MRKRLIPLGLRAATLAIPARRKREKPSLTAEWNSGCFPKAQQWLTPMQQNDVAPARARAKLQTKPRHRGSALGLPGQEDPSRSEKHRSSKATTRATGPYLSVHVVSAHCLPRPSSVRSVFATLMGRFALRSTRTGSSHSKTSGSPERIAL